MKPTVQIHSNSVNGFLKGMGRRAANPPMRRLMVIADRSVKRNFQEEGRPDDWEPLSDVTKDRRKKGKGKRKGKSAKILQDTTDLKKSIDSEVSKSNFIVYTNHPYAAVHQFGAEKGSFGTFTFDVKAHGRRSKDRIPYTVAGHRRTVSLPWGDIPARPYMMFQKEDIKDMSKILLNHVIGVRR